MEVESINNHWTVYMHVNKINNKKYIGITGQNPIKRWNNGLGYKECPYFYYAIQKYGWNNFEHKILYSNKSKDEAVGFEKELITKYKTKDHKYGYNLTGGGEMVSAGMKKAVYQFSADGIFMKEYQSISEAARAVNTDTGKIIDSCRQRTYLGKGYFWCYKDEYENPKDYEVICKQLIIKKKESYINGHAKIRKRIYRINTDGNVLAIFNGIVDAVDNYGYSRSRITQACANKSKYFNTYWLYENDYEELKNGNLTLKTTNPASSVLQFSLNGIFIQEFASLGEAVKATGGTYDSIRRSCESDNYEAKGFLWKFKDEYNGEPLKYIPRKNNRKPVVQFDLNGKFLAAYASLNEVQIKTGYKTDGVGAVCRGRSKTSHGFIWKYAENCMPLSDGTSSIPQN